MDKGIYTSIVVLLVYPYQSLIGKAFSRSKEHSWGINDIVLYWLSRHVNLMNRASNFHRTRLVRQTLVVIQTKACCQCNGGFAPLSWCRLLALQGEIWCLSITFSIYRNWLIGEGFAILEGHVVSILFPFYWQVFAWSGLLPPCCDTSPLHTSYNNVRGCLPPLIKAYLHLCGGHKG